MPSERARAIVQLTVAGQSNVDRAMNAAVNRVNELKKANQGLERQIDNHKRVQGELRNNLARSNLASKQRVNVYKEEGNALRRMADLHTRNIKQARLDRTDAANIKGAKNRAAARKAANAEIAREQRLLNAVNAAIKSNDRAAQAEAATQRRTTNHINGLVAERERRINRVTDAMRRNRREIRRQEHEARRLRMEASMGVNTMSQLAMVSGNVLIGVGGALSAGLYVASRGILSYNTVLNETAAVSNATASEIRHLDQQARRLGLTTEKSASEAAAGQRELGRAGFIVNEVLAATPGVLALSTIGNIEMGRSAEYLAGTLRQFELEAEMSNRVVDVFAQAVTSSLFNVEGLGVALGTAGPLAHQFNIPLERTVALLSTVRSAGVGPARTGTGLRSFLAAVANMSQGDVEILNQVGIQAQHLTDLLKQGDISGIGRILENVEADILTKVFGTEASNVTAIISAQHKEIDRMEQVLLNSAGAAESMREVMNTGVVGAFREAKSAADGLILSLGDRGLTGGLTIGADVAKTGLRFFDRLPGPFRTLSSYLVLTGPLLLGTGVALRLFASATEHATISQIRLNAANVATNIGLTRMKTAAVGAAAGLGGMGLGVATGGVLALGVGVGLLVHHLNNMRDASIGAFDATAALLSKQVQAASITAAISEEATEAQIDQARRKEQALKEEYEAAQKLRREEYVADQQRDREQARQEGWLTGLPGRIKGVYDMIRKGSDELAVAFWDGDAQTVGSLQWYADQVAKIPLPGEGVFAPQMQAPAALAGAGGSPVVTARPGYPGVPPDQFVGAFEQVVRSAGFMESADQQARTLNKSQALMAHDAAEFQHRFDILARWVAGLTAPTVDPQAQVVDRSGNLLFDREFRGSGGGSAIFHQDPFAGDDYIFAEDVGGGRLQLTIILESSDPRYQEAMRLADSLTGGLPE